VLVEEEGEERVDDDNIDRAKFKLGEIRNDDKPPLIITVPITFTANLMRKER
jgi:hypothetical protein